MNDINHLEVYLFSDATGETTERMARAFLAQYKDIDVRLHRFVKLKTLEDIRKGISEAVKNPGVIVHSILDKERAGFLAAEAKRFGLEAISIFPADFEQAILGGVKTTTNNKEAVKSNDTTALNGESGKSSFEPAFGPDFGLSKRYQFFITPVGDNVSDEDLLGRDRLIHVLKGLIFDTRPSRNFRPFVIGIFGKWGSGKSTVINLLEKQFSGNNGFSFLTFNAWQNEHCTHMGAALANRIIEQLYRKKSVHIRILYSVICNVFLKHDIIGIGLLSIGLLAIVISSFLSGDQIYEFVQAKIPVFQNEIWPEALKNNSWLTFIIGFLFLICTSVQSLLKKPFTAEIMKLVQKPDYSVHLGISEQIKVEIEALFKVRGHSRQFLTGWLCNKFKSALKPIFGEHAKTLYSVRQFIVIIDDLDRCSDGKILETLEAIRLIIDLPNVIVVLAVDQSIMITAVANRFSQQNKNLKWEVALTLAREFLGKIIQISIELETPDSRQAKLFVAKRLYADNSNADMAVLDITQRRKPPENEDQVRRDFDEFWDQGNNPILMRELFEGDIAYDDYVDDQIDKSEDYLKTTPAEAETFSKCVGAFEICNPRTLVRIHNTITLLKGLHPEIASDTKLLNSYIYLSFLQETYAMRSSLDQIELAGLFDGNESSCSPYLLRLRRLGDGYEIFTKYRSEIRKAVGRVRKLSLASVTGLMENREPVLTGTSPT